MRISYNTIDINEFSTINKVLAEFRSKNNLIHPYDNVNSQVIACNISNTDIKALEESHKQGMDAVSLKDKHLHYYHTLLTSQLSNPKAWGMFPIVDSLNLTLAATEEEVKRAIKFFNDNEATKGTQIRVKYVEDNRKRDRRVKSRYLKKRHVWLEGEPNKRIYLWTGLVGGQTDLTPRPIRISLNPSVFTGSALRNLFSAINDTNVFDNFWESLADANITRVDLAADLIGVPTPTLIFNTPRCMHYDYEKKRKNSVEEQENKKEYLQTQYAGNKSTSHFKAYDKVKKKEEKNQKHVCTINGPDSQPLYYTRIERVLKLQSNGSNRKFKDLVGLPHMFKEVQFYSPTAFKELGECQYDALETGFLFSLFKTYEKTHGLSAELLEQTIKKKKTLPEYKNLSEKQILHKLKKSMLSEMHTQIERYKLTFASAWFEERQRIILRNILKFMLPKKYRENTI
ncbi:MAG: hypothetical protein CVV11_10055 [Gammaproteobacteria bacterium HGW-Gammaproteobacteria-15]|nr:MAG: hypothetical protein CVV11_10055 [Gammaproteobacteria bacterium HGW-Gammaproteobacteria-15]